MVDLQPLHLSPKLQDFEKYRYQVRRFDTVGTAELPHQELAVAEQCQLCDAVPRGKGEGGDQSCLLGHVIRGETQKS